MSVPQMEYGASLLRFMPRASGSRADRARCIDAISLGIVGACVISHPLSIRQQAQLRCHFSAQRRLLTAVFCSSHGIGLSQFFRRFAGSAVYPDGSDPQLYRVNTTISVTFPTREGNYIGFSAASIHIGQMQNSSGAG